MYQKRFFEKGKLSNLVSFFLLVAGLAGASAGQVWSGWVLAAGLFGFAGGITNWLAVKMLFDRVPLLYGSGVIPHRFREIRATVKDLIMTHFFDPEYLQRFFGERLEALASDPAASDKLATVLASEEIDAAIERKIAELMESPIGAMLKMAGGDLVKSLVKQFIGGLGTELAPQLAAAFARPEIEVGALRRQVDQLLEAKLEELTPEVVKRMMEDVIREHLGWLIVWGNIFGGALGLLARALGY